MKYDIYDMSDCNIASNRALMWVGEAQWVPTQIGEDERLGKGGHMTNHEHTPKFKLDWVFGWIGKLIRLIMFIKYRK